MATEKVQDEKMTYRCRVHAEELLPLLCKDCDSPVCVDCVTTTHAGHQLCKISECIEDTIIQLNDAMEGNESARFDLKKIEENLQYNKDRLETQVEEMIQRVTEREDDIVKEVKKVCKQTVEQIKHIALETENPMKNDAEIVKRFKGCNKFRKENDEEFIKCLFFFNELKLLQNKFVARGQNGMPFSLESHDLLVEKIVELVGFFLKDKQSSSDEDTKNIGMFPLQHETDSKGENLPHQYRKKFTKSSFDDIVLMSPEKKFIACEDDLYHLTKTNVHKLGMCTKHFTYVAETDEIIFTENIDNQDLKIYRQPVSTNGSRTLLFSCGNEKPLCLGHNADNYLIVVTEATGSSISSRHLDLWKPLKTETLSGFNSCRIRFIDEMGCLSKPTCSIENRNYNIYGRFIICLSSFVQIHGHQISVKRGFSFDSLFSYSGSRGNEPSKTFSPSDVCADPDGNFVVIDSLDNTVHLLDPKGEFLRIIMSAEDGLRGITRIAMDTFGWLWMGCDDGSIHFANYQYFKSTTRRDRYLEKQKNEENV